MKTFYKTLRDGKSSNCGDRRWSLPWDHIPGEWMFLEGNWLGIKISTEVYSSDFTHIDCDVYEVEPGEVVQEDDDGDLFTERARLLRKLETPGWISKTRDFVAGLSEIPWMQNDGNPNPEWRLFETRNSAYDNTWGSSERGFKLSSFDIFRKEVYDSVLKKIKKEPVLSAVHRSVYNVTWDVMRHMLQDATLYGQCLLIENLLDPVHFEHAKNRMEVWQKGYGLFGDVDGILYVYKRD